MQFRCDREKRVVLVLGKRLICRQKLQIHLRMRDSSQWYHGASQTHFFITMRRAEALTPAVAWTLSNSLTLGLIQNHSEFIILYINLEYYNVCIYIAGNASEKYCASMAEVILSSLPWDFKLCCHGYLTEAIFYDRSEDNRHPIVA